jgi:putative membrane protein
MDEINCDLSDKRTFFAWQRNHMANERTFLAWCRTGISLIAFGFVIERFDILIREMRIFAVQPQSAQHMHSTSIMGATAFALGAVIILLAGWRFFYIRKHINRGETDFSVLPDLFLMGSVLVTIGAVFFFFAFFF